MIALDYLQKGSSSFPDQQKDIAEISNVTKKELSTECKVSHGPNPTVDMALGYKGTYATQSLI